MLTFFLLEKRKVAKNKIEKSESKSRRQVMRVLQTIETQNIENEVMMIVELSREYSMFDFYFLKKQFERT